MLFDALFYAGVSANRLSLNAEKYQRSYLFFLGENLEVEKEGIIVIFFTKK